MSEELSEPQFEQLADAELKALVDVLSDIDESIEADLESGILTLSFEDGPDYVINSHRAARQIWMAAERQAWHFDFDGSTSWIAKKSGDELWAAIEQCLGRKLGRPVSLRKAS